MAWIGAVMNVIGGVAGIAGGAADGQATQAQRAFSSQVARENARAVGDQSAMRQEAMRRENDQVLGAQRAAIAESGTGAGGSNGLIAAQDATLAELDLLTERFEGRLKMTEYDNQADRLGAEQTTGMQRIFGKRGFGALSSAGRHAHFRENVLGTTNRAW